MTWFRKLTWPRRAAAVASWGTGLALTALGLAVAPAAAVLALVTVLASRVIVLAIRSVHSKKGG